MSCTPVEPVPMTPTRLPARSTPSFGQRLVNNDVPAKEAIPGMSGSSGADKIPVAATTNGALKSLAGLGWHHPDRRLLVEGHRDDLGVELDVAAKIKPVGDEVQVGLHLGLGRHRLRPHPFLLDLLGEAVGVFDALDVTARTGIAVVQPSPADVFGHLQHAGPQSELPQPMQRIQAGESRRR